MIARTSDPARPARTEIHPAGFRFALERDGEGKGRRGEGTASRESMLPLSALDANVYWPHPAATVTCHRP